MATIPIVNTQDKRIGLITSVATMVLVLVIMWLIQYEIADPPPEDVHLEASAPLDKTIIENIQIANPGGGGGGNPSKDPKNETNVTEQIITTQNSSTSVNSGQANSTNSPNSNNPPSGDNVDDPFSGGIGGGNGGGSGTGNGTGVGTDTGPGTGPGGGGGTRTLLAGVNADDIQYNYDVKFYFNVSIDSDGVVVYVENIPSRTTTSDEIIIRKVMDLVKKQVRYSKAPNTAVKTLVYNVNFRAR